MTNYNQPKVWISTHAYNAEKTIRRAIESVLNQTYDNFCYVIRDNGSTDATLEICREYEKRDPRIRAFHNRLNHVFDDSEEEQSAKRAEYSIRFNEPPIMAEDDFSCVLDADDEYAPDFFRCAIEFAETAQLDIVAAPAEMIVEATGARSIPLRMEQPMVLQNDAFSDCFPQYHWYLRQMWGKLFRPRVLGQYLTYCKEYTRKTYGLEGLSYGGDTLYVLYAVTKAKRFGILAEAGYHYYIQEKSLSTSYPPNRVDSDWILHHETERFLLNKCGYVSEQNRRFLADVYANAVNDTVNVIYNADIPKEDKLREYRRIAEHPVTKENFAYDLPDVHRSEENLIAGALLCRNANNAAEEMPVILNAFAPKCAGAFSTDFISLLDVKPDLMEPLINDNLKAILKILLEMLRTNEQTKKFDLCAMVSAISTDKPLLKDCCDKKFLRRYGDIYLAVWRGQYAEALDAMTGRLLDGEKADEAFLQLYLSLAALQNQPAAFVFGKVACAKLYLRQGDKDACRAVLDELAEMGVEENEEISGLRNRL